MGEQWLLRAIDSRHNHPPSEILLQDPEYREWFRTRTGGASELDSLLSVVRMTVDSDPACSAPPLPGEPVPPIGRAREPLQASKRSATSQDVNLEDVLIG